MSWGEAIQGNSMQNDNSLQNSFMLDHECIIGFNLIEEKNGFVNANKEIKLREIMPFGVPCAKGKVLSYRTICYDFDSECWPLISQFLKVLHMEDILEKEGVIDFFLYRDENKNLCYRVNLLNPDPKT